MVAVSLKKDAVEALFKRLATKFPGAELAFDVIPRSLSKATCSPQPAGKYFPLPPMPWGLDRNEIAPTLRRWHPGLRHLRFLPYRVPGRLPTRLGLIHDAIHPRRNDRPSLIQAGL